MPEPRTEAQLERTAIHEAAHVVMGHMVGRPLGFASIRPGEGFNGLTAFDPMPLPRPSIIGGPTFVQPWQRRSVFEAEIATCLAGTIAVAYHMAMEGETGYLDSADDLTAKRLADEFVRVPLTEQQEAQLADAERQEIPSDEEQAQRVATFLADECASTLLAWLRREVELAVRAPSFQVRLNPVAALLLRDEVANVESIDQIFQTLDRNRPARMVFAASKEEPRENEDQARPRRTVRSHHELHGRTGWTSRDVQPEREAPW